MRIKNYRYQNITVKGHLDKRLFEGVAAIKDNNAELNLNGIIDFNNKTPRFDLVADVTKANLKNLKLTKDSITFRGKLNLNFASNSLDIFTTFSTVKPNFSNSTGPGAEAP